MDSAVPSCCYSSWFPAVQAVLTMHVRTAGPYQMLSCSSWCHSLCCCELRAPWLIQTLLWG
jgi:hypothetical protein